MRTVTVEDNHHWKALQQRGADWLCIACDAPCATNLVTWADHLDTKIFSVRYCNTCLPEILVQPPIEQRLKLPQRSPWELKLTSSEGPCDICGSTVDLWEGMKGRFVLCRAHFSRRGYLKASWRLIRRRPATN